MTSIVLKITSIVLIYYVSSSIITPGVKFIKGGGGNVAAAGMV